MKTYKIDRVIIGIGSCPYAQSIEGTVEELLKHEYVQNVINYANEIKYPLEPINTRPKSITSLLSNLNKASDIVAKHEQNGTSTKWEITQE